MKFFNILSKQKQSKGNKIINSAKNVDLFFHLILQSTPGALGHSSPHAVLLAVRVSGPDPEFAMDLKDLVLVLIPKRSLAY